MTGVQDSACALYFPRIIIQYDDFQEICRIFGEPKKPLIENGEVLERLSNELSAWKTASSELATSADAADETPNTGDGFFRSPEFAVGFASG